MTDDQTVGADAGAFPRVLRMDAQAVVEALFEQAGIRLTVEGSCVGGQVGTAYVRDPDGVRRVLKTRAGVTVDQMRAGPLAVLDALRAVGYPGPATVLVWQLGDMVVFVHELLPGGPLRRFDGAHLDRALELNALQADVLRDRPDVPAAALYLNEDGPDYCLHEPLRRYSERAARLEAWVARVGDRYPPTLPGDDAVHHDFHPGNMLGPLDPLDSLARVVPPAPTRHDDAPGVDSSTPPITGIVDWDGAARGHRGFDLVTLRFGLHAPDGPPVGPGVVEALDARIDALPERVRRPAWAHMSLRMCDWAVRHFEPGEVGHWLDLAEMHAD